MIINPAMHQFLGLEDGGRMLSLSTSHQRCWCDTVRDDSRLVVHLKVFVDAGDVGHDGLPVRSLH